MTHILQPLDVGIFQHWKHWHQKAIKKAVRSFDLDYSISSLFRDLTKIRAKTFCRNIHDCTYQDVTCRLA